MQVNSKIVSLRTLQSVERSFPEKLSDIQLIRKYGQLKAIKRAVINDCLPDSYYVGVADAGGITGKVPKDVMAIANNLDYTIEEYSKEIQKRRLVFDIFIKV